MPPRPPRASRDLQALPEILSECGWNLLTVPDGLPWAPQSFSESSLENLSDRPRALEACGESQP
eukprot:3128284-Alexandrium_andersonii.AAC.1